MKLLVASLAILSANVPHAEALCLKNALLTEGYWFDDPTLGFDDGIKCNLAKVKRVFKKMINNLSGCGTLNQEVRDVFGTAKGVEINNILRDACDDAPEPSNDPVSFRDILDLDFNTDNGAISLDEAEDRFLKEFYDGNTFLNQEVGTYNALTTKKYAAFNQIKTFDNEVSQKAVVGWPSEDVDNFNDCSMNTVMCCWVADRVINNGDNNGDCKGPYPSKSGPGDSNCIDANPADNTDICYVDNERSPQANHVAGGFILYPGGVEQASHCHGFIWANDEDSESNLYKANNLFYVSMEDHLRTRGYVRNVPGAPMCGCLEQMPTVSRADCTQTTHEYLYDFSYTGEPDALFEAKIIGRKVSFKACDGATANDLASKYEQMVENGEIDDNSDDFENIVVGNGNCEENMVEFVESKGFKKIA